MVNIRQVPISKTSCFAWLMFALPAFAHDVPYWQGPRAWGPPPPQWEMPVPNQNACRPNYPDPRGAPWAGMSSPYPEWRPPAPNFYGRGEPWGEPPRWMGPDPRFSGPTGPRPPFGPYEMPRSPSQGFAPHMCR
ncbi:exported hypothetical protein [Gammaproteobacteria bacterium]